MFKTELSHLFAHDTYCKQQKLSKRKVLQFTQFHLDAGKAFTGLASSVLKVLQKAIAHKIHWENFHISSKICENRKSFLSLNFYRLRYKSHYALCITYNIHGITPSPTYAITYSFAK